MAGTGRNHLPLRSTLLAAAALAAATVLMTWPQALALRSLPAHQDVLFSMWRLEWIAHALGDRGLHLFDANIFHPATGTLAYSDATLLEGVLTAPLVWAGVTPAVAYNLVLLLGMLASALGMFALVSHLTGESAAGLVAALPFAFAPYRFEHYMHLELQWAVWIPLAFLFVHRAIERRSIRDGISAGICVWLQALSCVYYAVFLAPLVLVLAVLLLATDGGANRRRAVLALAAGAGVGVVLATPYALPYIVNARTLGPRSTDQILRYSATAASYLAAPANNGLYGWTAGWGAPETHLFPGLVVLALSALAFARGRMRLPLIYLIAGAVALALSFGLNGAAYRFAYRHVGALGGLRAPARASILVLAALSVLAGLGVHRLRGATANASRRAVATAAAAGLLLVEYWSGPLVLAPRQTRVPEVYRFLRGVAPAVVLELPVPRANRLPGREADYEFWSIYHWNPLVNGYSGYYPSMYIHTIEALVTFPDDRSIERLRSLGTRYIVIHRSLFTQDAYTALMLKVIVRPELESAGVYKDWAGDAAVFVLRDSTKG